MTYAPAEDSFLLEECIELYSGKSALEIGVGSGMLLGALQKRFDFVVGTDIDLDSLSRINIDGVSLVCCDATSAFSNKALFDLVVTNPPYQPDDARVKDMAVHGGPTGIETTIKFVLSALPHLSADGRMLLIISSLANIAGLDNVIVKQKLKKKVVGEKRLFYEMLSVLELSRARSFPQELAGP